MKWPAKRMATQAGESFGMFEVAVQLETQGWKNIYLEPLVNARAAG
jgi:hypothetical protein